MIFFGIGEYVVNRSFLLDKKKFSTNQTRKSRVGRRLYAIMFSEKLFDAYTTNVEDLKILLYF